MNKSEFRQAMKMVAVLRKSGDNPDYWKGFQRGLRRAYHGEKFGTEAEHQKWWSCAEADISRLQLQEGYRAGYNAKNIEAVTDSISLYLKKSEL